MMIEKLTLLALVLETNILKSAELFNDFAAQKFVVCAALTIIQILLIRYSFQVWSQGYIDNPHCF